MTGAQEVVLLENLRMIAEELTEIRKALEELVAVERSHIP